LEEGYVWGKHFAKLNKESSLGKMKEPSPMVQSTSLLNQRVFLQANLRGISLRDYYLGHKSEAGINNGNI
jgi:hypothetical protein